MISANSNNKFVVEEIKIPDNEMQKLNRVLKSTILAKNKSREIRAVIGGTCSTCFYIPTKKVAYDVGGSKLVDWYCNDCFEKHKQELDNRIKNMNLID